MSPDIPTRILYRYRGEAGLERLPDSCVFVRVWNVVLNLIYLVAHREVQHPSHLS